MYSKEFSLLYIFFSKPLLLKTILLTITKKKHNMFENININRVKVVTGISADLTGSGLAVLQGFATVKQVGIAQKTLEVEQQKAAHVVAALGTESTRNAAQAAYFNTGAAILADVHQNNANLIAVRNQLLLKLTTCTDPTERENTLSTITAINQSLGANNAVVGATLNNGATAQQVQ